MTLAILEGKTRTGDAVHNSQAMAATEGFKNVSRIWLKKCVSYDKGFEQMAQDKAQTEDIMASLSEMRPMLNPNGQFVMRHMPTDREFRPTTHALDQMAGWSRVGKWYASTLVTNPVNAAGEPQFVRDNGDTETLLAAMRNGFRRIEPEKKFLWRTRKDGTLRAMLSDLYSIVNNEWFLKSLQSIIPGGMLSHWYGNSDTVFGNILIPDTIRAETDSDYGGMLSVGNSEIGERRVSSRPSVFRAICMNGCIWDQEKGKGIRQVHRGNINLAELFEEMKTNLEAQIPLLTSGIDRLLGTQAMTWDGSAKPVFAQVAIDQKLTKTQATSVLNAYATEAAETPDLCKSLFAIINSVTRAGQKLDPAAWVRFDEIGGRMTSYDKADWERLTSRAKKMKVKEVEAVFALSL